MTTPIIIDAPQYRAFSEKIFREMHAGGVSAVRETVANIETRNRWFERFPELIFAGFGEDEVAGIMGGNRLDVFDKGFGPAGDGK